MMEVGGTIPRMPRDQHDRVVNRTASFVASQVELPSRSFVANQTNRLSSVPPLIDLPPETELNGNMPRFDSNNIYMDTPSMSHQSSNTTGPSVTLNSHGQGLLPPTEPAASTPASRLGAVGGVKRENQSEIRDRVDESMRSVRLARCDAPTGK